MLAGRMSILSPRKKEKNPTNSERCIKGKQKNFAKPEPNGEKKCSSKSGEFTSNCVRCCFFIYLFFFVLIKKLKICFYDRRNIVNLRCKQEATSNS